MGAGTNCASGWDEIAERELDGFGARTRAEESCEVWCGSAGRYKPTTTARVGVESAVRDGRRTKRARGLSLAGSVSKSSQAEKSLLRYRARGCTKGVFMATVLVI